MSDPLSIIKEGIRQAFAAVYSQEIDSNDIILQETKKEFQGDYTFVVFPYTKTLRKKPEQIAEELGEWLIKSERFPIASYNVIKGFLNLELNEFFWQVILTAISGNKNLGKFKRKNSKVLVEFSSPNTNKPLHLGHIRNILLGWSTAKILDTVGYDVVKTQIINDRGIAICKSMLAWQKNGESATPQSTGIKGDHFVGQYYREFENKFKEEYTAWQDSIDAKEKFESRTNKETSAGDFFKAFKNDYFNEYSALGKEAKEMLLKWEAGDAEVKSLWSTMNGWVYDGFNQTYDHLGVSFDVIYHESETYLLGKDLIAEGLANGKFYKQDDGSVWVDLEHVGLDKKILLRSDGTSVYMTQDLGTALKRYVDLGAEKMIYVVADEQDYHFQVLFETMKKLEVPFASGMYHLSYGMVELPSGRMKSREGTVVDADDLMSEVIEEVKKSTQERGELEGFTEEQREDTYRKIGLAALKFFILKVNPKKRMIFNPAESVDVQGQTGPYVQNAYVRIMSVKRRLEGNITADYKGYKGYESSEVDLLKSLMKYEEELLIAAEQYDPSNIATFAYDLAKKFHKFYHEVRILQAESEEAKAFRLILSESVARVLEHAMDLLGIEMPERM